MHKFTVVLLLQLSFKTLCVHSDSVGLAPIDLAPIPCNDKAVEKLSRLAVTYINEDRDDGYKFALNRVANVHLHAQGPAGNVYYLDLDVLETKCHVGSPKPWKRCDIRPFMETQISGNCNTTILHTTEGYSYLYSYDCTLVPDAPEKLQQTCPTCPLLLPTDNVEAQDAARLSLATYKRQSTIGAALGVKKVTRASKQVTPVKASFVEYTVQECPEGVTRGGTCQRLTLQSDTETAGFCTGSVYGETNDQPDIQVSCEMFKLQNADNLRPVEPQGHDLPIEDIHPTTPYPIPDLELQPVPSDPTLPPVVHPPSTHDPTPFDVPLFNSTAVDPPSSFDPTPSDVLPFNPSVPADPSILQGSSSSESAEDLATTNRPQQLVSDSSSEEIGGPVALRPPSNFRYQKSFRVKRQVLAEVAAPHKPTFLSDFPSGISPFRSCPGPSRFTTV